MFRIKFRIRLKCIKEGNGYNIGNIITIFNEPFDKLNGVAFHNIDDIWEILSVDTFINLHDKNGKEIYHNDIITKDNDDFLSDGKYSIIEYTHGSFGYSIRYDYHHISFSYTDCLHAASGYKDPDKCSWLSEIEVVGNIYDNINLIENG